MILSPTPLSSFPWLPQSVAVARLSTARDPGPDSTSLSIQLAVQLQGAEGGKDIQAILAEVDRDGDGQIDYDEFVAMMMKARLPALPHGCCSRAHALVCH